MCIIQCREARGLKAVEPPRPSTADFRAGTEARTDESLALEPLKRGMNCPRRNVAVQASLNFFQNGAAISPITQPHNREENCLFE